MIPDRLPDAEWRRRPALQTLADALGAAHGDIRVVGGAVRDGLLGLPVKDIDMATVHRPETVMELVRNAGFKAVPTGLAHGTVTAVVEGRPVEITTLRRDVDTDGRHATVAFGTDWREDAARRDFTINALSADPASGELYDYFGGLADLAEGRVRFIGDPVKRIDEDHLRILRFFRFTARFGQLDRSSADYAACVTRAPSLMALSRERIADELLKLLTLPDPEPVVDAMVRDGILKPVLPEIDGEGVAALAALIAREDASGMAPDPLRRLAALVPPDPVLAEQIAARLRLSNKARVRIRTGLEDLDAATPRALAYWIGIQGAQDRILLGRAFTPDALTSLTDWTPPRLPLSGGDLIAMGVPAGPLVAQTLRRVETEWVEAGFPDARETRARAAQAVADASRDSQY